MKSVQNTTLSQAKNLAKKISKQLKGGEILALSGPLGSGKTAFTKALGKNLGIKKNMPSPTFVLMHEYEACLNLKKINLFHLDFYRMKSFSEVKALGLKEIWNKKSNIIVIEWADKFKKFLPKNTKYIYFEH